MAKPKYIETPEKLWELFKAYEEKTKSNPIKVQDYVGKDGLEVERERERPLTVDGFEDYLFEEGIINDLGDYFSNKDGRYKAFTNYLPYSYVRYIYNTHLIMILLPSMLQLLRLLLL